MTISRLPFYLCWLVLGSFLFVVIVSAQERAPSSEAEYAVAAIENLRVDTATFPEVQEIFKRVSPSHIRVSPDCSSAKCRFQFTVARTLTANKPPNRIVLDVVVSIENGKVDYASVDYRRDGLNEAHDFSAVIIKSRANANSEHVIVRRVPGGGIAPMSIRADLGDMSSPSEVEKAFNLNLGCLKNMDCTDISALAPGLSELLEHATVTEK